MAIYHDNIIYISIISKLGGVESFAYYMAKKYKDLDIAVLCKSGDAKQLDRIRRHCPAYVHRGEDIECKVMIINYDTSILDYVKSGDVYMVVHADYSQPCYTVYPNFTHPKIKKVLGITQYICDKIKEQFNVDCELCYNPIVAEDDEPRLTLVSATRLSKIKGGWRMKALAEALDLTGINYVWYVFTNDQDSIGSKNVIFLQPRLDVYKWIKEADYLVQLSDTEACSYAINEALMYGTQVVVTPLPYLKEFGIEDNKNALIMNFNCDNVYDIVKRIKDNHRAVWTVPKDNYKNILAKGKSHYTKEIRAGMKKVRVKVKFRDMMHNNIMRYVGEEFVEEDKRATDLIDRGFLSLVENIEPKVVAVEKAVKEERKEKAIVKKELKKVDAKKKNAKSK